MSIKDALKEDLERFADFLRQSNNEVVNIFKDLKERHPPAEFIVKNRLKLFGVTGILLLIYFYPLVSIWILACFGTGYPAYSIIRSYIRDNSLTKRRNLVLNAINAFVRSSMQQQSTMPLPLIKGSGSVVRNVIIVSEYDDGLIVRDPITSIDIKYSWDNINMFLLYENSVKPFLEAQGQEPAPYVHE